MKEHQIDDRNPAPLDEADANVPVVEGGVCPECAGAGSTADGGVCPLCEGSGRANARVGGG